MEHWARYLSYTPQTAVIKSQALSPQNPATHGEQGSAVLGAPKVTGEGSREGAEYESIRTVVPFELMLREMRHHNLKGIEDVKMKIKVNVKAEVAGMKTAVKNTVPLSVSDIEKADRYCYSPHSCSTRVSPLTLAGMLNETRSHICVNRPRFVGRYKMVFFMQCVRMLWPIAPAAMKTLDLRPGGLSQCDQSFIRQFHNISKNTTSDWYSTWVTYPVGGGQVGSILVMQ